VADSFGFYVMVSWLKAKLWSVRLVGWAELGEAQRVRREECGCITCMEGKNTISCAGLQPKTVSNEQNVTSPI
jgi:hypothetical protein